MPVTRIGLGSGSRRFDVHPRLVHRAAGTGMRPRELRAHGAGGPTPGEAPAEAAGSGCAGEPRAPRLVVRPGASTGPEAAAYASPAGDAALEATDERAAGTDASPPAVGGGPAPGVGRPAPPGPCPPPTQAAGGEPAPPAAGEEGGPEAQRRASERALLRAARAGDAAAFGELVAPLMQPAFQFALRLVGDRDLAEDVTQEALLRAFTGLHAFRGDARFRTWVFRIVHHACADVLRRRARRSGRAWGPMAGAEDEGDDHAAEVADPAPGPEDAALERTGRAEILSAVASLPAEQRAVVLLRDVHGLAYEEIAAVTGQSLGTVKSRLHRARHALRAALEPSEAARGSRAAPGGVQTARGRAAPLREPPAPPDVEPMGGRTDASATRWTPRG